MTAVAQVPFRLERFGRSTPDRLELMDAGADSTWNIR